jgi:hypothetical protein
MEDTSAHLSLLRLWSGTSKFSRIWLTSVVLALGIAIGHFIFASFLDSRAVPAKGIFRQSYESAISTALVFCFRAALTTALSSAFLQRLWRSFRSKPMKASTIESLLAVLQSPLNLLQKDVVRNAKLEWLFALCYLCIPIATIFPPGALTVELKPRIWSGNMTVPTFSPSPGPVSAFHIPFGLNYMWVVLKSIL